MLNCSINGLINLKIISPIYGGYDNKKPKYRNLKKSGGTDYFLWISYPDSLHRESMSKIGSKPQIRLEARMSHVPVVLNHICPLSPQGLLLLRFHINIYKLLESIKSILYNSE